MFKELIHLKETLFPIAIGIPAGKEIQQKALFTVSGYGSSWLTPIISETLSESFDQLIIVSEALKRVLDSGESKLWGETPM